MSMSFSFLKGLLATVRVFHMAAINNAGQILYIGTPKSMRCVYITSSRSSVWVDRYGKPKTGQIAEVTLGVR